MNRSPLEERRIFGFAMLLLFFAGNFIFYGGLKTWLCLAAIGVYIASAMYLRHYLDTRYPPEKAKNDESE